MLSMSYEKDWKKIEKNSLKKLENLNKGSTFAPRNTESSLIDWKRN